MDLGLMDMGKMSLGTMDLGFGINGVGIHGVAGILIFNPGRGLDWNAMGCTYVLAFETRSFLFAQQAFVCYIAFTEHSNTLVSGTCAKHVAQDIDLLEHPLGLG